MRVRDLVAARRSGGWAPALLILLLLPATVGAYTLTAVRLNRSATEATLDVTANEPIRYEINKLPSPDRIVLDILDADAAMDPLETGMPAAEDSGWLKGIRASVLRSDQDGRVIRYEVETEGRTHYGVTATGTRLRLCVALDPPEDMAPPIGPADPGAPGYFAQAMSEGGPTAARPEGGGAPMSLDVQGADIRTVLRSIAEFATVNIIPDRDVTGETNVRLVEVPWRQALDIVCESSALTAIDRDDDVIRVASRKTLLDEEVERNSAARKREELLPLKTAIFQVKYANADELRKSVAFALSTRGSAEVDMRTNSVLVTDIADRVEQIADMVQDLDTETLQVDIVAKLVDVDVSTARRFGITWNVSDIHNSDRTATGSVSHNTPIVDAATEVRFGVVRDWANIDATLQALEQSNKANIISNPRITTVNNRKARILVGKEVPLIVLDKAGNPITELKKVGITLEVTPYINSDDRVTMDLHPEVSDLSSQSTVQGGIVFSTSEADTRVMVADGQTAVIGGLISESETRFENGIPVLKNIPLIGNLFKSSDTRKGRRELLIFVTPRIVRGLATNVPR